MAAWNEGSPAIGQPGSWPVAGFFAFASGLIAGDSSASAKAANAAKLTQLFSTKGIKYLPVIDFYTDPFTISAPCTIYGQGANDTWGPVSAAPTVPEALAAGEQASTIIRTDATTGDLCTITSPGVRIEGIHFQGAIASTSGTAIKAGTNSAVRADGFKLEHCSFKWFHKQVQMLNCAGYTIANNFFLGARQNALYIDNLANVDYGDPAIYGNTFAAIYKAPAAIYIKGGGGAKINTNKFVWASLALTDYTTYNWTRHVHVDNPTGATSVLVITGNSMEVADKECVFVDCSVSGQYHNIMLGSNQITFCGAAVGEPTLRFKGRAGNLLHNITIAPNTLQQTRGIYMEYVSNADISRQTWYQFGGLEPYIDLGPQTGGVSIERQHAGDNISGQGYFRDQDANANWTSLTLGRGSRDHVYVREIPGVSSNAVYSNMFQFWIPEYGSAEVEVSFACSSSSNGQATLRAKRLIANEFQAPVIGIIGTDTAIARVGGTTAVQAVPVSTTNPTAGDIDVQFTTGNSGIGGGVFVNVNVKRTAGATGTALNGILTMRLDGAIAYVKKG